LHPHALGVFDYYIAAGLVTAVLALSLSIHCARPHTASMYNLFQERKATPGVVIYSGFVLICQPFFSYLPGFTNESAYFFLESFSL
jgi:hypothetical protein